MINNKYSKVAKKYLNKYYEYSHEGKIGDIMGNIICLIAPLAQFIDKKNDYEFTKKYRGKFLTSINYAKDYFRLLDKYPDFKEAETTKSEGYFPEFNDFEMDTIAKEKGYPGYKQYYIDYCKKKLKHNKE